MISYYEKYQFFIEIAQCGNLTRVAEKMMVSQSALSKYLQRLESSLGVKLFDRSSLPMKLTTAGEIFLRHANQMVSLERQCSEQLNALKDNLNETLRIGMGSWMTSCLLPHILPSFRRKYPYVRVEVFEGNSDAVSERLLKGTVDVGVLGGSRSYDHLDAVTLAEERILLLCNSANPIMNRCIQATAPGESFPHADIQDFRQERFVMTSGGQAFFQTIQDYFAAVDFQPSEILDMTSLHTGMYMTAYGDYISFLPEIALHTLLIPDNISFCTFGDPMLCYSRKLRYCTYYPLSKAALAFIDHVSAYFAQLPFGNPRPYPIKSR